MMEDAVDDQNELAVVAVEGTFGEDGLVGLRVAPSSNGIEAVELAELQGFLEKHAETVFVTCDAAVLHWQIVAALGEENECWWRVTDEHRLHDLGLLSQLVLYANEGSFTQRPSIDGIAKACKVKVQDSELSTLGLLLQCYQKLLDDVALLKAELDDENMDPFKSQGESPFEHERYGPLAVGLDTNADIALRPMRERGVRVAFNGRREARERAEAVLANIRSNLVRFPGTTSAFRASTAGSTPIPFATQAEQDECVSEARTWLLALDNSLRSFADVPIPLPFEKMGRNRRISLEPNRWQSLAMYDTSLAAWIEASQFHHAIQALSANDDECSIAFEWATVPRLVAVEPSVKSIRNIWEEAFYPRDEMQFCVIRLSDLPIRCLSFVLHQYLHEPLLLHHLASSVHPYDDLGESFRSWIEDRADGIRERENATAPSESEDADGGRITELQDANRRYVQTLASHSEGWPELVQGLLQAIVEGAFGKQELLTKLQTLNSPLVTDSDGRKENTGEMQNNVERLMQWFTENICSGAGQILLAPDLAYAEHRLGNENGELLEVVGQSADFELDADDPFKDVRDLAVQFRRFLESENPPDALYGYLRDQAGLQEQKKNTVLWRLRNRLLLRKSFSNYGRIGSPRPDVYFQIDRISQLSDDMLKSLVYGLARIGFPVVAMSDEELVVEIPKDGQEDVVQVLEKYLLRTSRIWLGPAANDAVTLSVTEVY